jgi:hypothetical protein
MEQSGLQEGLLEEEDEMEGPYIAPEPPCPESFFARPRPLPEERMAYLDGKVFP